MLHVGPDEVAGGEGTAEGEFAGEDGGADDAGETAGVLAGVGGVGASDAEHIEHGALRLEDGAASEGTDFETGHRDGDLESTVEARLVSRASRKKRS